MDRQILQLISKIKEKFLLRKDSKKKISVWKRRSHSEDGVSKFGIYLCKKTKWCLIIFECFNRREHYHGGELLRHIRTFKSDEEVLAWLSTKYGQNTLIREFKRISKEYQEEHWPDMKLSTESNGEVVYEVWYMDYSPWSDPWSMCRRYETLKDAVGFVINLFTGGRNWTKVPDEYGLFFIYALTEEDIAKRKEYIERINNDPWMSLMHKPKQAIIDIGKACNDLCAEVLEDMQTVQDGGDLDKEWKSTQYNIILSIRNEENEINNESIYRVFLTIPDIEFQTNGLSLYYRTYHDFHEISEVYEYLKRDNVELILEEVQCELNGYMISMPSCY